MQIDFKIIDHSSKDYESVVALRQEILRTPLGLAFTKEELEREKNNIQVAGFIENEVVATASLAKDQPSYRLRLVAVKENLQGLGVGSKLLDFCENYARKAGASSIYCNARNHAVSFYTKKGYLPEGQDFTEVGIMHIRMRKKLSECLN